MPISTSSSSSPNGTWLQEDIDQSSDPQWQQLVSSFPREKGWGTPPVFQYQGFWQDPRYLQGLLACQRSFQAQDSDVLLATIPKSGTTWLKAILFALLHRTIYDPFDAGRHPLLSKNPHELVLFLEKNHLHPLPPGSGDPRLIATHSPFVSLPESVRPSGCKIVYLCRNPADTFVSFWQFANKLRPVEAGPLLLDDALDSFCRGVNPFGPFWDHALGYWRAGLEQPEKVFFLRYEEMKEQPAVQLRRLTRFLGCPFSDEEEAAGVPAQIISLCSFESLRNVQVNKDGKLPSGVENRWYFRRGEIGDWKNHLTVEMADRLNQIVEKKLSGSGLKF